MLNKFVAYLSLPVLAFTLVSCGKKEAEEAAVIEKAKPLVVEKASSDTREYMPVILENGLRVLLISDADTTKAAVSLNVDVGSGADPKGREGLAHFVEHMLFLGTEKYPEADAYQQYISEKGGSHNAYTAFEDTNYFFDIEPAYLESALDRFSQFFTAPLFTPSYLERERLAVHSEYKAKLENPFRRTLDVFKQVVNPEHPYAKFSVGTRDTLKTEGLEEAVKTFYQQYYFAENMALVVLGAQPLSELEAWVAARFTQVPAKSPLGFNPPETITQPLFNNGTLPHRVDVQSLQDNRRLSISFPLPDLSADVLNKSTQLVGHLLGHEGDGSLFAYLKAQGLAESLSSGLFMNYPGGALFSVNIQLTPKGFERSEFVTEQVYATLRHIASKGIQAWRYQELSKISAVQFDYQPKARAQSYVRGLASMLDDYEVENWLNGGYMMAAFDKAFAQQIVNLLVPENSLVLRSFPGLESTTLSPWYSVPYKEYSPTPTQLDKWKNAELIESVALPKANPFVPESLALHSSEKTYRQAHNEQGVDVWFYQEPGVSEPRAFSVGALSNSNVAKTATVAVVNAIAANLIDDEVNKALYDAKAMGYSASVSSTSFGISISTYGFDNKLAGILGEVINQIQSIEWSEAEFLRSKAQLSRFWQNKALEPVYQQLNDIMVADQLHPAFTREEVLASLEELDFASFLSVWQQNKQFTNLTALNSGNLSSEEEQALIAQWLRMKPRGSGLGLRPKQTLREMELGNDVQTVKTQGADTALLSYWRSPVAGIEGRALSALTAQVFESPFYHQLRTEQQLGYIVYMNNRLLLTEPGLMTVVQSPSHSSDHLLESVNGFVKDHILVSESVSEESFESYKSALIKSLLKPSTNVSQAGQRAWRSIVNESYTFDEPKQISQALEEINYQQWVEYVEKMFSNSSKMQVNYKAN